MTDKQPTLDETAIKALVKTAGEKAQAEVMQAVSDAIFYGNSLLMVSNTFNGLEIKCLKVDDVNMIDAALGEKP